MYNYIKYLYCFSLLVFICEFNLAQENTAILCADGIDNDGDGQIDCADQECVGLLNDGCRTCFDDGLSFADNVIDYNNPCGNSNMFRDPDLALGVSDLGNFNGKFVSLGSGGWIKLGFTNNLLVNSGNNDADLWVFEIGDAVEPTVVALQPADIATRSALIAAGIADGDADGYFDFGRVAGATSSVDIDAIIGGFAGGDLKFDAVKLTDEAARGCNGQTPGADIDAICALSSIPNEICGNNIDDDADGLTDCDDPDIENECCCLSTTSLDLGQDITTCIGDTILLFNDDLFTTYQWQDGSVAPTLSVTSSAQYGLTVTDDMGCQQFDRIGVFFRNLPLVNRQYFKCPNQDITIDGTTYESPGMYSDTIFNDQTACDTINVIQILNHAVVNSYLGPDLTVCESSISITSPFLNTHWPDGSSSDNFSISESNSIIASAIDSNTCVIIDTIGIEFIRLDNFYMPNAFSPNNDGINDQLAPLFASQNNVNYTLRIFDRWGNRLTDISGPRAAWDGYIDSKISLNGTYLWTLEFTNEICGTPELYNGDVLIVR